MSNEPVAWMYDFLNPDNREEVIRNWITQTYADITREKGFNVRPLYTHPAPQPVTLTDEEIWKIYDETPETNGKPFILNVIRVAISRATGQGGAA